MRNLIQSLTKAILLITRNLIKSLQAMFSRQLLPNESLVWHLV